MINICIYNNKYTNASYQLLSYMKKYTLKTKLDPHTIQSPCIDGGTRPSI